MANYEFKLDTKEMERKFKRYNNVPQYANIGLKKVAAFGLNAVKKLTPWKTGNLRRNWFSKPEGDGYIIYNNVEYAYYVEKGHKKRGGGFISGRFMLRRTFDQLNKIAPSIIEREIESRID